MNPTAALTARIAELKVSTGTHEFAATWIPAAVRELETALGWAMHLDIIEAANPNQGSTERENAARWIADHTERGERIASEAGAYVPATTAPTLTHTFEFTTTNSYGDIVHTDTLATRYNAASMVRKVRAQVAKMYGFESVEDLTTVAVDVADPTNRARVAGPTFVTDTAAGNE